MVSLMDYYLGQSGIEIRRRPSALHANSDGKRIAPWGRWLPRVQGTGRAENSTWDKFVFEKGAELPHAIRLNGGAILCCGLACFGLTGAQTAPSDADGAGKCAPRRAGGPLTA